MTDSVCRPLMYLERTDHNHPKCWERFKFLLQHDKMLKKFGEYPKWCLFPLFYSYTLLDKEEWSKYEVTAIAFGILQLWRLTKGIYKFDTDVYDALIETGFKGNIPVDVFYNLPEWCVYIETPTGVTIKSRHVYGIYVALDYNIESNDPQLVIMYDVEEGFIGSSIYLTKGTTIEESFQRTNEMQSNRKDPEIVNEYIKTMETVLPLIMYMCSEKPEYYSKNRTEPIHPCISKTRSIKERSEVIPWDVAIRTGSILKKYKEEETKRQLLETGTGIRVKPHMRRAHWHGFWKGPRSGQQTFFLRWVLATPVNMKLCDDNIPAVTHAVQN